MNVTIHPSNLKGTIQSPPSKSCMQRACAVALLSKGRSIIKNFGQSNDDKAALDIIEKLGATTKLIENNLIIESSGIFPKSKEINCVG